MCVFRILKLYFGSIIVQHTKIVYQAHKNFLAKIFENWLFFVFYHNKNVFFLSKISRKILESFKNNSIFKKFTKFQIFRLQNSIDWSQNDRSADGFEYDQRRKISGDHFLKRSICQYVFYEKKTFKLINIIFILKGYSFILGRNLFFLWHFRVLFKRKYKRRKQFKTNYTFKVNKIKPCIHTQKILGLGIGFYPKIEFCKLIEFFTFYIEFCKLIENAILLNFEKYPPKIIFYNILIYNGLDQIGILSESNLYFHHKQSLILNN